MKIKKININGYDVFIYKTKQYSSINMKFLFETDYTKDWVYKADLLTSYMSTTTKKYPTRKALNDRDMELYSLGYSLTNSSKGVKMLTTASFSFYDPVLVKDDYLFGALEFARDIMLEPNFEGSKLDSDELSRCRDNIINRIGEDMLDNHHKAFRSAANICFPNTYVTEDLFQSKEEAVSLLESYTDKDLIECHKKIFAESCVGLIIMGNIKDEYLDYIEKIFKFKSVKKLSHDFKDKIFINEETPFYTKESDPDFNESILRCAFHCPAESYKEEMTYAMISRMLGNVGMLLHKVIRDEMKLVYSASVGYNRYTSTLVMKAFLDKKNEEKALEGFDKVIEMLHDELLVEEELAKIKEKNDLQLYTYGENKWEPFKDLYNVAFDLNVEKKAKFKVMDSITKEDIIRAVDKLEKKKVHFYEGSKE